MELKTQQWRVLHHPINYSHCTQSSAAVGMTRTLAEIKPGCGEHGNGGGEGVEGGETANGNERDDAPINSHPRCQSFNASA